MREEITYNTIDSSRQYFLLRKKEGRIYSDKEVLSLPEIDNHHRFYNEWKIRQRSSVQLIKYLAAKKRPLQILEIGCGNGWLSAKLSAIPLSHVTGIDINAEELNQASRVFDQVNNLEFFNCSLQNERILKRHFDIIIFAASIQYFRSLKNILDDAMSCMKQGGEIHIIDTHFYSVIELTAARQRSKDHFNAIGFPEMAEHYFHHSLEHLGTYNHKILYDPHSLVNKVKKTKNPFYWVCVIGNA